MLNLKLYIAHFKKLGISILSSILGGIGRGIALTLTVFYVYLYTLKIYIFNLYTYIYNNILDIYKSLYIYNIHIGNTPLCVKLEVT